MGIYAEYLNQKLAPDDLNSERKKQLGRIASIRGRNVLVYASGFNAPHAPHPFIPLINQDFLAFNDQLANLRGTSLDLILETPGGSGEVAEQMVRQVRGKYGDVAVIIPGAAKSAGTIMAMCGNDLLMGPTSALGPIDAQMSYQGKVFSAEALLEGLKKIKEEVEKDGKLNLAYVPILQQLSPGELQNAQNALNYAKTLVARWLAKYKFKNWTVHSSTNKPVTGEDKEKRAREIAEVLCDHQKWLMHGAPIMLDDLREMRLLVEDYSEQPELADAIDRYYVLLQMTFEMTNIYKVFETPKTQIYRFIKPTAEQRESAPDIVAIEVECPSCKRKSSVQANLGKEKPLQPGMHPFPANNKFNCPNCHSEIDLSEPRRRIEEQSKRQIVT
jgi:hypothetical protein